MMAAQQTHPGQVELADAAAPGMIRTEIPFLTRYGTVYGLFDVETAAYDCLLKSDTYHLGEYVGDRVRVSGPLVMVEGMPEINVTSLQLLKMKWMR